MSAVGIVGGKELLVTWTELLCTAVNGLLEKYVIYYQRENESAIQSVTASPSCTVRLICSTHNHNLIRLVDLHFIKLGASWRVFSVDAGFYRCGRRSSYSHCQSADN